MPAEAQNALIIIAISPLAILFVPKIVEILVDIIVGLIRAMTPR